jgi:predicted TIM-barrel fold metal-dependent hydrolase
MAHDGFKVIDSDMHVIEPADLWQSYIDPAFKAIAPVGEDLRGHHRLFGLRMPGKRPGEVADWSHVLINHMAEVEPEYQFAREHQYDGESQLYAMDKEGIDVALLYPSRGLFVLGFDHKDVAEKQGLDPKFAAAIARAYNDWLHDFAAPDRRRLVPVAMVAPHEVESAVAETRRCVEKLGFKAIFLLPGLVNRRHWHDPYYYPLWEECERLGIAIGFHGGGPDALTDFGVGFAPSYLMMWHTFSHSVGPMAAAVSFTAGGVLQNFPRLRVGFLEANCSWAPWLMCRLDDHYEDYIGRFEVNLKMKPSEYFKRNCYVSVEADEKSAKLFVDWFGDDNVVFSTDYPHPDSKFPHAVDKFMTLPLSDETRRKFLWDNCARLYNID